jgi:tetratricopeptide (TPR) repeat protein
VFSISIYARAFLGLGVLACAACADASRKPDDTPASQAFYTVTAEIALARGERRVAALQYAAAAATETDGALLQRATDVAAECLQPTLAARVAVRWISIDPASLDAQRAAARAALALDQIEQSAAHFRIVLASSPSGTEREFAALEAELGSDDNVFGARRLADRLVSYFPSSPAALRVQGFTALRADDPAAAAHSFAAALALAETSGAASAAAGNDAHKDLVQALARAQIMSGDADATLAHAQALLEHEDTPANRLDYALLLLTAQRNAAATEQLELLARLPAYQPVALHLMALVEFQEGNLDAAGRRFSELLTTGKFLDEAFYYLGLIAERRADLERALRLYAQVQAGDDMVPALLRAITILRAHGAAPAAEELLDRILEDEPQRAPELLAARAKIYSDSGDLPRAFAVLDVAIMEYPDSVELRYAMASTYEEQGRVAAALRELSALVKARPDDPGALNALGYTLADHKQELTRARKLIERAYSAAPRNAAILDSLGWVLFRQGQVPEALPYLTAAYADDRGAEIGAHLGEVLWRLGKNAEAERIWSEAGEGDADNRLLKATRQRLHASN